MMYAKAGITGEKVLKVLGAACMATGVVALSAVVASGAAAGAVAEGFKSAKNTMQRILKGDEVPTVSEDTADNINVTKAVAEES